MVYLIATIAYLTVKVSLDSEIMKSRRVDEIKENVSSAEVTFST